MGHDAFVDSYRKPNFKLHLIIFVTIVGVSVFLSTQVEKSKDNTRVQALKIPVPIDSVFVDEDAENTAADMRASPKPVADLPIIETETEYRFESGPSLADIDKMLAKHEEPAEIVRTDEQKNIASNDTMSSGAPGQEKDIAIMVTDTMVTNTMNAEPVYSDPVVNGALVEEKVDREDSNPKPATSKPKYNAIGKMDTVYELQQDRFLETLAKTATLETEETAEIKRIKEAIRADRPLTIKSAIKSNSKTENNLADNKKSMVKVASSNVAGVIETKSSEPGMTAVANNSKVVTRVSKATVQKMEVMDHPGLTKSELNNVLVQFTRSYNKGDINRLIALFDENANTNDQRNKLGIKAEYTELFKSTADRKITIKNMHWNLGKGKAIGGAKFVVTVKPKGSATQAQVEGNIEITAIKESRGVFIKSLIHTVSAQ